MNKKPDAIVLGEGRWGRLIQRILTEEGHKTISMGNTRQSMSEDEGQYIDRWLDTLCQSDAEMAWIATPPGHHTAPLLRACIRAGLDVVVEKPWLEDAETSSTMIAMANESGVRVAVHHQYLFLDSLKSYRERYCEDERIEFSGSFVVNRPDNSMIPPMINLGCHLHSIRHYVCPNGVVAGIHVGYDGEDARWVRLKKADKVLVDIDFTHNREPIIQRFIDAYCHWIEQGGWFPASLSEAAAIVPYLINEHAG